MKRIIILISIIFFSFPVFTQTQTEKEKPKEITVAEIQFEKNYFDFGKVKVGEIKEVTVTYTNTGKKPLILDEVHTSCDCTTVDWSKAPVMPGQKGSIKATYTAKEPGMISKRVTVFSNAESYKKILELKGEVE
jgi:hypothetical protein